MCEKKRTRKGPARNAKLAHRRGIAARSGRLPVPIEWQHLKRLKVSADVIDPVDLRRSPAFAIIPRTRDERDSATPGSTTKALSLADPARISGRVGIEHCVPHDTESHNGPTSFPSLSGADTRIKTVHESRRSMPASSLRFSLPSSRFARG